MANPEISWVFGLLSLNNVEPMIREEVWTLWTEERIFVTTRVRSDAQSVDPLLDFWLEFGSKDC